MEGAGLFDLTLSRGPAPISVAVKECTFRLNALLAFNRKRPKTELQIRWEGEANQYEILGRSWIVDSASEGGPAFSKDIDDLDSWLAPRPMKKRPSEASSNFGSTPPRGLNRCDRVIS